jgi:tetratricopeptide (TPR) repeat protein
MKRTDLLTLLLALGLIFVMAPPRANAGEDEDGDLDDLDDFPDDPDDDDDDGEEGPGIEREDEDDVENWSFEGEKVEKVEEKKEEKRVGREVEPEPKRYGNSGNWYEVTVDCARCPTLLDQTLGIEDPLVMRQFYDFIQISSDRKSGKFVFPSIGENRPMGVSDKSKRIVVWQYVIDVGARLTDTYATIWDLSVQADGGLLYGRKYEVQAWTDKAYTDWEKGYKSDESFISKSKLLSYADLAPVRDLTTAKSRFQVGDDARITFAGYAAFVRSDVDMAAIEKEQERLRDEAEREAKRIRDQKEFYDRGVALLDDKEFDDALEALLKSKELGLDSLDLHYNLGFAYYMLKDYEHAKKHYRAILDEDPRDTDVRYNLARIYEKEKDWDSAIREYQAILKFDPDDAGSRDRLELLKAARDMVQ